VVSGKRLAFTVNLFDKDVYYASINDQYDEFFAGGTLSLTKAIGDWFGLPSQSLRGTVSYTFEDAHIGILPGFTTNTTTNFSTAPGGLYQTNLLSAPIFPLIFTTPTATISFPKRASTFLTTHATA